MYEMNEEELKEIISSYGLKDLVFIKSIFVEPDTCLYIFHDKNQLYCLVNADYLGDYIDIDLPCDFEYDYYVPVVFHAIRRFSYIENALKRATGYIDDDHLWTKAPNGDPCMLFACDEILHNGRHLSREYLGKK